VTGTGDGSFGMRLRGFREAAGLSQEDLADRAGLSSHAVSALERGVRTRPYPHTVRALADALRLADAERAALIAAVPARNRPAGPDEAAATPAPGRALPVPPTPLLGRDADVDRVAGLLRRHRLVTLTGTGGVGKTRLAVAAAGAVRDDFADGMLFVELAPLRDVEGVLPAVADALDATLPTGGDPALSLASALRGQQLLLVLDNVEHLIDVAPRIATLVEGAPGLTVLSTSRAALRVRGEHEVAVEPLALPDDPSQGDAPAVRLLLERADAVTPGWGTAVEDAPAVAEICVRLAGLPLAIELAAARSRVLDPRSLLARLDAAILAGGRDRPERQRTMRATLDWSYSLLGPDEQTLLRLLAVFVGGFRLDDLEGVVARAGGIGDTDTLSALESLAEQSLVATDPDASGGVRHRLLEPVTQYAAARLAEAGERDRVARAHAGHFLAVAEELAPRYRDGGQVAALARVDAEHPNLTAAVEELLARGEASGAGRLCWALWMYWWLRGHHSLGRRLAEAVLQHELRDDVRPRAELAAATMAFAMDDLEPARRHWEAALEHAGGDHVVLANSVAGVGLVALGAGDLDEAADLFARARDHAVAGGADGDWTYALSWIWSGTVSLLRAEPDRAVAEIEQGLASARRRGDRLSTYIALYNLSQVELTRGRPEAASVYLREGTVLSRETSDLANLAYLLEAMAVVEGRQGTHARVPLLLGAAQAIREGLGSFGYGYYRPDPQAIVDAADQARLHLGADRYDDALDVGRGLDPDRAAALVLGEALTAS